MPSEHDPYACPICLAIGQASQWFPAAIRTAFVAVGVLTAAMVASRPLWIVVGAAVGFLAAELTGAVIIHAVRRWVRRRFAKLDDPEWREAVRRYNAAMRAQRRRAESLVNYRCEVGPFSQYPTRR